MPTFTAEHLRDITSRIFVSAGMLPDEAEMVARSLVTSNLMGHDSHGVIRIQQYLGMIRDGQVKPGAEVKIVREAGCTAVLDGGGGFGQIVARKAMAMAIDKAQVNGMGAVAVRHSNHVGRLGEYPMMAAEQDMIGMAMVNNHGGGLCMAPFGGIERRLSPNPISFAIPTGAGKPILLDMTSSTVAEGKLRVMRNRREEVPEGWLIDAEGRATTDPEDFYRPPGGALLPLGGTVGYKGFGLCLVMDIMAGALSGAGCSQGSDLMGMQGVFVMAMDVGNFAAIEEFEEQVDSLIHYVKSSPTAPGVDEILVPGEPEFREERKRLREGVHIEHDTWSQIAKAAEEVGLDVSHEVTSGPEK